MKTNMNRVAYNAIMNNAQKSNTGRMNAVIPVGMIDVDHMYQRVEGRNPRKLNKLRNEWDYNLMDALMVVPHPETYNFFVVDGLGRLTVAKEIGLEEIDCVIINGPADPDERRKFEARYFLRQAMCTDPMKPIFTHNARVLNGDPVAIAIETVCKEYGVSVTKNPNVKHIGSYERAEKIVKRNGEIGLRWVFDVIKYAGYDQERRGYSGRLIELFGKFYDGFPNIEAKALGDFLRPMSPIILQSNAVAKYPKRAHNPSIPMILYLQDWAVNNHNEIVVFDTNGRKMVFVAA